jgi:hypothetical protein
MVSCLYELAGAQRRDSAATHPTLLSCGRCSNKGDDWVDYIMDVKKRKNSLYVTIWWKQKEPQTGKRVEFWE